MTKAEILAAVNQGLTPAEIATQNHDYAIAQLPHAKAALSIALAKVRMFAQHDDLIGAEAALRDVTNIRATIAALNSMV